MGVSYGLWGSNLNINAHVKTAELELELIDSNYDYEVNISESNSNTIAFSIENTGSIAAKLNNIEITPDYCSTTGSAISIDFNDEIDIVEEDEVLTGNIMIIPELLEFEIIEKTDTNQIYEAKINISFNFCQPGLDNSGWTKTVNLTLNIIKIEPITATIVTPPTESTTQSAIGSDGTTQSSDVSEETDASDDAL